MRARILSVALATCAIVPSLARAHATQQSEEQRIAAILQSTLVSHGGEVHRCFEKALADTMEVSGKLELEVDVGDAGRVVKTAPGADEVKSPVLLACLLETAQTWTLAGIDPGSTVVVPLSFEGQAAQFSVKVADAPARGPAAAKQKGPAAAPFSVKVLVDEATMRAQQASLSLLTISAANRIAMHKHPGAEMLYVVSGKGRLLGPTGTNPEKLDEGSAVLIPAGMPHVIENMARTSPVVLLQFFIPPGPERVYRDATDARGRAAFEVIRDMRQAKAPAGAHFTVADASSAKGHAAAGVSGKSRVRVLIDAVSSGGNTASLVLWDAEAGAEEPRHSHAGAAELLYVIAGAGTLTVGSEKIAFGPEQALHLPADQPHAIKFTDKSLVVAVYAPAGAEERFKKAAPAKGK